MKDSPHTVAMGLTLLLTCAACGAPRDGSVCKVDSATYVGAVDLERIYFAAGDGPYTPRVSIGGAAEYAAVSAGHVFPSLMPACGAAAMSGSCCYVAPPPDAGEDSFGIDLSIWTVTVTDETDPDAGGFSVLELLPDGGFPSPDTQPIASLTIQDWTGGDRLLIQGGGDSTIDAFTGELTAPSNFEGLNPNLFPDAGASGRGAIPLSSDLALTWTPTDASSFTIALYDEATGGEILCAVPDNGAFTVPKSMLAHFDSGDQGALALFRSASTCIYSQNAAISVQAQNEIIVRAQFQ